MCENKLILKKKKYKSFSIFFKTPFFFIFKGFLLDLKFKVSKKNLGVLLKKVNCKAFLVLKIIFFCRSLYSFKKFIRMLFLGCSFGWFNILEFSGRGYFINCNKNTIKINLGFSHGIGILQSYKLTFISKKSLRNKVILYSGDLFFLRNISFKVRSLRPVDSYKGRGVKYLEEKIKLKVGKRAF